MTEPRSPCARADCDLDSNNGKWCVKHERQFRRTGTPYRRDELNDERLANRHRREMDAALEADPPLIRWFKGPGGIKYGTVLRDTHRDIPADLTHKKEVS
jgi:hypothetical protein